MSLAVAYIPEKLIQANIEIQGIHHTDKEFRAADYVEDTEALIRRLAEEPEDMLRAAALALPERDIHKLAGYLPYNYFQIDESRLFEVVRHRLDERSAEILFAQWQEAFDNPVCNTYLKTLVQSDTAFRKLLERKHIKAEVFLKVLDSANIPLSFDEELIGHHFSDGAEFDEKLKYYGVTDQSFLDIECKRALLAFCGRTDYFSCSQENITEIVKSYDAFMLRRFLLNFMSKMTLSELQLYPELAHYLRSVIGHRRSDTFQEFFADVDPALIQKYVDWINIYKINSYFENDDRSRFWKQYRYLNIIRYPVSNTVILEFEAYVAVEFLGPEKGTIYICDKEVFRQEFYAQTESMDNDDIRIFFRIHKDKCIEYRNHTGRWQAHIGNVISKKGMAEKIRI